MYNHKFLWTMVILLFAFHVQAQETPTATSTQASIPTETPTPKPIKHTRDRTTGSTQIIVVHKPQPPTSWGKVIQYKREEILALSEKNRETLHEFVFQDEDGLIRTATYHESATGDGYWEVWLWDQP